MKNPKTETDRFLPRCTRRASLALVIGLAVTSFAWLAARAGGDGATRLRWDLIHLTVNTQGSFLDAGGIDWAKAADGSQITLTGSGTWLSAPGEGEHGEGAVTGGGTWETFDNTGISTGKGTYTVTRLIEYTEVPGVTPAVGTIDSIGNPEDSRAGLVIFKVLYSDGEEGVLTISCHGGGPVLAPNTVFEGITTTKGFVGYVDRGKPVGGVDANRTAFHILAHGDDDGHE